MGEEAVAAAPGEEVLGLGEGEGGIVLASQVDQPVEVDSVLGQPVERPEVGLDDPHAGAVERTLEAEEVDSREVGDGGEIQGATVEIVADQNPRLRAPRLQGPHQAVDLLRMDVGLEEVAGPHDGISRSLSVAYEKNLPTPSS